MFRQALSAVGTVRELIADGRIECDAIEPGHLKIAHRPSRAAALRAEAELLQREFGYPASYLSRRGSRVADTSAERKLMARCACRMRSRCTR